MRGGGKFESLFILSLFIAIFLRRRITDTTLFFLMCTTSIGFQRDFFEKDGSNNRVKPRHVEFFFFVGLGLFFCSLFQHKKSQKIQSGVYKEKTQESVSRIPCQVFSAPNIYLAKGDRKTPAENRQEFFG